MAEKNRELIRLKEIDDGIYKTKVYGIKKKGVIWAVIYQGIFGWYKRIWDKKAGRDWFYVVRYADEVNGEWIYEHFLKFVDARKRALEIAEIKTKVNK